MQRGAARRHPCRREGETIEASRHSSQLIGSRVVSSTLYQMTADLDHDHGAIEPDAAEVDPLPGRSPILTSAVSRSMVMPSTWEMA